ncbi:hypothetical protein Taro_050998 [Colocasia esculenta]|uniref:Retrotransposon gag domain-containing protein n=1 Tax=Colocasia esculenta TaxID=4460 RepID=A0A843XEU5_COLES|nr:hypothetical protein [Colocasia esculenta]
MAGRPCRSSVPIQDEETRRTASEQPGVPAPQGPPAPPPPPLVDYGTFMQGLVQVMQTQVQTQAALQTQLQAQERADMWWSSVLRTQFKGVELEVTWGEFVRLFEAKYVPEHVQDKMEQEFLALTQGSMLVLEYEARFAELSRFAQHVVAVERQESEMELYQEEKRAWMKRLPELFQRQNREMKKLMEGQQSAIVPAKSAPQLVASTGSEKPECVHCGKHHGGDLCWTRSGRCLKCGSKDHQIRECLNLKTFVPRDVPATTTKEPTSRQQAPARVYALTGGDADHVTIERLLKRLGSLSPRKSSEAGRMIMKLGGLGSSSSINHHCDLSELDFKGFFFPKLCTRK